MAEKHQWYRLDNAARVFPALINPRYTTFFRMSVTLKQPVRVAALNRALELLKQRFPYYHVILKEGFFWDYLEPVDQKVQADLDIEYPNTQGPRKNEVLFRVYASGKRISLEFCHMVTDGTGAIEYLKSLLVAYYQLLDCKLEDMGSIKQLDDAHDPEEVEDAFRRYYTPMHPVNEKRDPAFQLPFSLMPKGKYYVTTGRMSVKAVKKHAKSMGVGINDFLVGLFIYALQGVIHMAPDHLMKKYLKPIRIRVPVNLRTRFPSRTMRNFFLILEPEIDPRLGKYELHDIAQKVHHQMKVDIDQKYLSQHLARNVRGEWHWLSRIIPRSLMNFILGMYVRIKGQKLNTSSLSNMGSVVFPSQLQKKIKHIDFIPQPDENSKISIGAISTGDILSVSFGCMIESPVVERMFFTYLASIGLDVHIESNRS